MKEEKKSPTVECSLSDLKGCGSIALFSTLAAALIILSGLNLFIRWTIEQALFESSLVSDVRWLVHLVYAFLLLLLLVPLYIIAKVPRLKLILRLWLIGAAFVFLTIPVKMMPLTSQNQSTVIILSALLLLIIIMALAARRNKQVPRKLPSSRLMGAGAIIGLLAAVPWLLWGALGSALDTLLVLFLGAAFGTFISLSLFPYYFSKTMPPGTQVSRGEFAVDGFVIFIFLLLTITGLGQNGSQLLLALSLPLSGWLLAALANAGKERKDHGRFVTGVSSGLLVTLPVLFFDSDELSYLVSGAKGEVMSWANQCALFTGVFLVIVAIYCLFLFKHLPKLNAPHRWSPLLVLLSFSVAAVVYFAFGQPGLFGDRLFVVFKEQADISTITAEPLSQRKSELYQTLITTAIETQARLQNKLDKWHVGYTSYYLVNGMEVNGGLLLKALLAAQPEVDRVLESPHLRPLPKALAASEGDLTNAADETAWNLEMIDAPRVWEELGVTGEGVVIGQTDSGVDGSHPELRYAYRGEGIGDDYNWLDPWNQSQYPTDYSGHGTGTLGIEVSSKRGVAPGAQWMGCVNLARNLGNPALYLDCMQFMFAPYPRSGDPFTEGDPSKAANIVNNSWGCPGIEGCDLAVFEPALRVMKAAGIFMAASAGNSAEYGCNSVTDPPATSVEVFTIGSVNKSADLSDFSSAGPVSLNGKTYYKPNILAPGESILLLAPRNTYEMGSGTSFAAPHVSGVVALMWSANPALVGDIDATYRILLETAKPYTGRRPECENTMYFDDIGIVDAFAAVQAALALK